MSIVVKRVGDLREGDCVVGMGKIRHIASFPTASHLSYISYIDSSGDECNYTLPNNLVVQIDQTGRELKVRELDERRTLLRGGVEIKDWNRWFLINRSYWIYDTFTGDKIALHLDLTSADGESIAVNTSLETEIFIRKGQA